MRNWEHESKDAHNSLEELRGIASPALIENGGLLITPKGKVDAMEINDLSLEIRISPRRFLSSPILREFLQLRNYSEIPSVTYTNDQ